MLRGRVLGRLALEAYWSDIDRALALAEEALQMAADADDTVGRLSARYALAFGCWTPLRTERLLAELDRYLDESVAAGDRMHELLAHRWMPPPMAEMGDVAGARREAAIAVGLADEMGNGVQQWMARQVSATVALLAGDLDRAASLAEEALMHGSVCEPTISFDYYSIAMWTLAWLRGDLETFAPLVEQAASAPGADAARRGALALTYAELGRVDDAREVLAHFTDDVLEAVDHDATWFMVMATVAEAAWHCGDRRCGATVARLLEPYVDRLAVNSVTATGPVAHAAGVATLAAGDVERGTALLHRAIEIGERAGTPVFVARTREVLHRL
jgi:tetratricopeptide (TPR) repeat protein